MPFEEDWGGATSGSPTDPNEPNPVVGDPSGDTSPGKHAILMVPDFKNALETGVGAPMVSYLRIGDAHSQAGPAIPAGQPNAHPLRADLGEDLASLVQGFTDDMRARAGGSPAVPAQPGTPGYTDSDGNWVPGTDPTPAVPAQAAPDLSNSSPPNNPSTSLDSTDARRQESALLHSKGGWRDHSDGNRITTTRGDKVEVIRGNYKLLVLGRSDPPAPLAVATDGSGYVDTSGWGNVTGVEMAGGNVDTSDLAYGSAADPTAGPPGSTASPPTDPSRLIALQTTFEWHLDIDGNWAWKQTTNVGSPTVPIRPPGGNDQIISNTWVDYQETNLGSPAKPVSSIVSSTYATTMTQTTNVTGALNQWTNAGDLRNGVVAGNSIDTTTSAPTINTATAAAMQSTTQAVMFNFVGNLCATTLEADVAAVIALVQAAAYIGSLQVGDAIINEQIAIAITNTFIGNCIDTHAGTHVDTHAGTHVDNHSGVHLDLHCGAHAQIDTGTTVTMKAGDETKIAQGYGITLNTNTTTVTEASVMAAAASFVQM